MNYNVVDFHHDIQSLRAATAAPNLSYVIHKASNLHFMSRKESNAAWLRLRDVWLASGRPEKNLAYFLAMARGASRRTIHALLETQTGGRKSEPPIDAEWLIRLFMQNRAGNDTLASLEERYGENLERIGRRRAQVCYWAGALFSVAQTGIEAISRRSTAKALLTLAVLIEILYPGSGIATAIRHAAIALDQIHKSAK